MSDKKSNYGDIFNVGVGAVLAVYCLLLNVGFNNTAFYPSFDMQSSLTIENACSGEFILTVM